MVSRNCLNNYISVSFLSKIENVVFARNVATTFIYSLNPTIAYLNEVKTLVSEAVTNAIIHGYQSKETEEVIMNIGYDEINLYIEVIDEGIGINDVTIAMEPMFTNGSEDRSGLGFTIMEVFSDNLDVKSSIDLGTNIMITKKLKETLCE